jgi:hypothetical protein
MAFAAVLAPYGRHLRLRAVRALLNRCRAEPLFEKDSDLLVPSSIATSLVFASINPPPKPTARIAKVVPTPAKNIRPFEAIALQLLWATNAQDTAVFLNREKSATATFRAE